MGRRLFDGNFPYRLWETDAEGKTLEEAIEEFRTDPAFPFVIPPTVHDIDKTGQFKTDAGEGKVHVYRCNLLTRSVPKPVYRVSYVSTLPRRDNAGVPLRSSYHGKGNN